MEYEFFSDEPQVQLKPGPGFIVFCTLLANILLSVFLFSVTTGLAFSSVSKTLTPLKEGFLEEPVMGENQDAQSQVFLDTLSQPANPTTNVDCTLSNRFPPAILRWCGTITGYANKHGLPPDLVGALIWQESGGNPLAYSRSGAVGLMQVMPRDGLAASFNCANGPCFGNRPTTQELQDPEFNVSYGTKMLAGLLRRYGNLREALKSYGPMNVGYYYADKVLGLFQRYGKLSP